MKKLAKIGLAVATLAGSAQFAFAQVNAGEIQAVPVLSGDLSVLITNLVNFILIIAGILAVLYLVWGGITYITAGGDAEKAGKGRTAITNAIIGIIIIMASFAIYKAVVQAPSQTDKNEQTGSF